MSYAVTQVSPLNTINALVVVDTISVNFRMSIYNHPLSKYTATMPQRLSVYFTLVGDTAFILSHLLKSYVHIRIGFSYNLQLTTYDPMSHSHQIKNK